MTKEEFLDGLRRALFSTGSEGLIEYNLDYYSSYIDGEIAKGRSMDDVMNELGDPRLIANSIKMAEGYSDVFVGLENEVIDENVNDNNYREKSAFEFNNEFNSNEFNNKTVDKDYNKNYDEKSAFKIYNLSGKSLILPIIITLSVLIIVVVAVVAVFSFLAPVLLPILAIIIAVGIIKGIMDNRDRS